MLSSTSYRNDFSGSGSLDTYSFTFPLTSTSNLVFIETTAGISTTKLLNTDYTATQNTDISTGGSVTRVAGVLPSGTQLTVMRILPLTQDFSFRNQTEFFPADYEDALDAIMMMLQQMQGQINASIKQPPAEVPAFSTILPAATLRANETVGFDGTGNVITS